MALKKCKECGHDVAGSAPTCPNCGVKNPGKGIPKTNVGGWLAGITVLVVLIGAFFATAGDSPSARSTTRRSVRLELAYLNEVPEVQWFEVSSNNVYIGFDPLPADWEGVIRGAALRCNQALDFGCHVWAVNAKRRGWRPGSGPFYGEVTARSGRIED